MKKFKATIELNDGGTVVQDSVLEETAKAVGWRAVKEGVGSTFKELAGTEGVDDDVFAIYPPHAIKRVVISSYDEKSEDAK